MCVVARNSVLHQKISGLKGVMLALERSADMTSDLLIKRLHSVKRNGELSGRSETWSNCDKTTPFTIRICSVISAVFLKILPG
jgi:hypothetical protein